MQAAAVQVTGLHRSFGARVVLRDIDLTVAPGRIVGLVGANGSGKTTLLKILAGFLAADRGQVRVFGLDPRRHRARIMRRARFVFAPPALFPDLSAREHLVHLSGLCAPGMPPVTGDDIDRALTTVGLETRAADRVRTFSFGMRQRLALAQALLPLPDLLVLDEPTDGLDPLAVLDLRAVLEELRDRHGVAILLASHLLVEIDRLVDHLLVLSEGRALFSGAPAGLSLDGERVCVLVDDPATALSALRSDGFDATPGEPGEILLPTNALTLGAAQEFCKRHGLTLQSFHVRRPTLEAALLSRLRRARAEGTGAP